jgi:hypothetical protein
VTSSSTSRPTGGSRASLDLKAVLRHGPVVDGLEIVRDAEPSRVVDPFEPAG